MRPLLSFLAFVTLNCLNCMKIQGIEPLKLDLDFLNLSASVALDRDQNQNSTNNASTSEDSSIINLEGEPSAIVSNCVNAITGDYLDSQTDMVVPGAQPIVIHRNYSSSMSSAFWGGWTFNHYGLLLVTLADEDSKGNKANMIQVLSSEGSGVRLRYEGDATLGGTSYLISLKGLTNCGCREISGRTNRKNSAFHPAKDFVLHTGSGATRRYKRYKSDGFGGVCFKLSEEKLANGNKLTYSKKANENARHIVAKNSASERLSSITQYDNATKDNSTLVMESCDGRMSKYSFAKMYDRAYLKQAIHSHAPTQTYEYIPSDIDNKYRLLARKSLPNKRQTIISYYNKTDKKVLNKYVDLKNGDPRIDRVKELLAPVGTTATPVVTHTFLYQINRDTKDRLAASSTTVFDALNRKSFMYHYDRNCCLRRVSKMIGEKIYRQDRLFWGSGDDSTNLISRVMLSEGKTLFCRHLDYDKHGNIRVEQIWGNLTGRNEKPLKVDKEFTYDFSNRLIREDEVHEDGVRLSITHKYNHLSERTSTTDFYGNVTKFHYDECGRLIETKLPNKVVLKTEYNALDQPIATYDGNGNCTTKSFNIRGKPCHVQYPDGSTETFEYTLDGLLERSVAKNGVVTLYTYDSLKRVTSQEKLSISGERLSITYSTYNAFQLLSETDEAGYVTEYQYDAAGRLIATTKGDSRTEYVYDSLGRIARTLEYINDHEYRATVKKYDLLDRVISEQIEDNLGKIFKKEKYAYDADGNVTKTTTFTQAGQAVTQTIYNAHQEPLYTIDALGHTTHSVYRYDYYNEEGQCVACQETTDPLGNLTIIIKDVNGQTAQILKRNAFGETTQSLKFKRDDNGNCLSQTAFDPERTIVTEWEYDALNRVIHTTEAVKTSEQKHSRYVYNLFGEKEKTIKPDGTELLYAYDDFGRLSTYKGSGFHYTYQYDLNSNPVCIKNLVTNTSTQRAFDVNDRLITEILENNLQLNYFYDRLGRLLTLSLPDHSEINYSYDANHLRKVYRGSYVHRYTDFDLSENLFSASSPIGKLTSLKGIVQPHTITMRLIDALAKRIMQPPQITSTTIKMRSEPMSTTV